MPLLFLEPLVIQSSQKRIIKEILFFSSTSNTYNNTFYTSTQQASPGNAICVSIPMQQKLVSILTYEEIMKLIIEDTFVTYVALDLR